MLKLARLVALVALLPVASLAEVAAVIEGPTTAKTGDLVVLSAEDSIGDGFRWITPDGVSAISCTPKQLAFAVGRPGKYKFTLIVADTSAAIDFDRVTVTVSDYNRPDPTPDPVPDQPGEPDQPDEPTPTPPSDEVETVRRVSNQTAAELGDPPTARSLAASIQAEADRIDQLCQARRCPTLQSAKATMVAVIRGTLLRRSGSSQQVDWTRWRIAVNDALGQAETDTLANYLTLMRAAAVGLRQSSPP